jgi:hypothetical protein
MSIGMFISTRPFIGRRLWLRNACLEHLWPRYYSRNGLQPRQSATAEMPQSSRCGRPCLASIRRSFTPDPWGLKAERNRQRCWSIPSQESQDPLIGALQARVPHAATAGSGNQSHSEASVANVNLALAGHTVAADFLMARAAARCQGGSASASGSSEIANLVVDGRTIAGVSFAPNTKINLVDALGVPVAASS